MFKYFKITLYLLAVLFFYQCAQVGALGGGKRDELPPKLINSIPTNNTTNFNANEIVLQFDEFVQVKNVSASVYINPKLKTKPEVSAEGKKVKIKLALNELEANTTYNINFGDCISDMHEGNKLKNFNYVFSTGPAIDTLSLKGIITSAFNNAISENLVVALYSKENKNDSTIYKNTPNYYTYTSANGNYVFDYLPKKEFVVVAFKDKNKNLLYDGESEEVAFSNENMALETDSVLDLKLFQELPTKNYIKKTQSPYRGYSYLVLNKKSKVSLTSLTLAKSDFVLTTTASTYDTLNIYYKGNIDTLRFIAKLEDKAVSDTIQINAPKLNKKNKKSLNVISNFNTNLPKCNFISLVFNNWIDTTKFTSKGILLYEKVDSLKQAIKTKLLWKAPNIAHLEYKYELGKEYTLKIDTGVFVTQFGNYNDSIKLNFKKQDITSFGKLTLNTLLNTKMPYIIQLINSKNKITDERYVESSLSSSNSKVSQFDYLEPDTYTVKIIFDENKNKTWDTGNYLMHIQPERVEMITKQVKIVSDWEIEEEIILKK